MTGYPGAYDATARDILSSVHIGPNDYYVAFRSGQYQYCIAVADHVGVTGSYIAMTDARITVYDTHGYYERNGTSYTYYPTLSVVTDDFTINTSQVITFTNAIEGFPALSAEMSSSQGVSVVGIGLAAILIWLVLTHLLEVLKRRK